MRSLAALFMVSFLVAVPLQAQEQPAVPVPARPPAQIDKPCPAGATVTMDLSAGEYTVKASQDPRLRIWWTTRDAADAGKVYANAAVNGTDARLSISGPRNGFHVTIEVPARSNAAVSLSAGKFSIDALDGDVDVSAWAGEMLIGVADPSAYYSVYASVTAGEIEAPAFQARKGGLLRSVSWEGKGRHSVRVRLTAGKIALHRPER
jgi:hypothetical protein